MASTLFVLQGGGPTAVINTTLAGIAEQASGVFDRLIGLTHSFEGHNKAQFLDLSDLLDGSKNAQALERLSKTPGALLGSSRKKVVEQDLTRVLDLMKNAGSDSLIGIGGNGTMAALDLLADYAASKCQDIRIIGVPKTVDNDLPGIHVAPGYGSAARFVAMAVRDYDRDFKAMNTFDDVTIFETMGRNTGWIAAASVLLKESDTAAPHMVLLPQHPLDEEAFLQEVGVLKKEFGRVFIVVNEMLSASTGGLVGESFQNGPMDSLGRKMYSLSLGTGNYLAQLIWAELGLQTRCLRPGNLGRAMSFCVSEPDRLLARRIGRAATQAIQATDAVRDMITIDTELNFGMQPLKQCIGLRHVPEKFLSTGPVGLSKEFYDYGRAAIGPVNSLF